MPVLRGRDLIDRLSLALPILLFLAHATAFLYFFVDDEGITLVFARNLLAGRGLTYSPTEGPIEGYSNFLHIWTLAGLLGLVQLVDADRLFVFVLAKVVSLACGVGVIVTAMHLAAKLGLSQAARLATGGLLALAGPLAVWSASALETVPFALLFLRFVSSTLPSIARPWLTAALGCAVALIRIDGALYAGIWIVVRLIAGDAQVRATLIRRVTPAMLAVFGVYCAWRAWYFESLLPLPLQSKIAHKLLGDDDLVTSSAPHDYLTAYAQTIGVLPLLPFVVLAAVACFTPGARRRTSLMLTATVAVLLLYVTRVGDWMFGFRFLVALCAPAAVVAGCGVEAIASAARERANGSRRFAALAPIVAALSVGAALIGASRFQSYYLRVERKPLFWTERALDAGHLLGQYAEIVDVLRPMAAPGTRIAFHEAGIVPFLLDADNLDTLGLCSEFVGALPTRDAVFTDVGRHYPLTPRPAFHAVHAYIVYRQPKLLITRRSWLRSANGGHVPSMLLDRHYEVAAETPNFVVYERTDTPRDERRLRVSGFLENLAHPAYIERALLNGDGLERSSFQEVLSWLWQGVPRAIDVAPRWTLHLDPEGSHHAHELYVEASPPTKPVRLVVTLRNVQRVPSNRFETVLPAGEPVRVWHTFDGPVVADTIDVDVQSITGEPSTLEMRALRVMGQTPPLGAHVRAAGIPD